MSSIWQLLATIVSLGYLTASVVVSEENYPRCGRNEILSPTPVCCEPTCTNDCTYAQLPEVYVNEPKCVCKPGFVRHKKRCILRSCCPKDEDKVDVHERRHHDGHSMSMPPNNDTISQPPYTNYMLRSGHGSEPYMIPKPHHGMSYKPKPYSDEKEDYDYSCEAGQHPTHHPRHSTSRPTAPPQHYPHHHPPESCRPCCIPTCDNDCDSVHCKKICIDELSYVCLPGHVLHEGKCIRKEHCPSHHPRSTPAPYTRPPPSTSAETEDYEDSSEGHKVHLGRTTRTPPMHRTTQQPPHTRTTPSCAPKCGPHQKLEFCRPCCVQTCENDCSEVQCPRICIAELNCVCTPGYVMHDGRCIRKDDCPVKCGHKMYPVPDHYDHSRYDREEHAQEKTYD